MTDTLITRGLHIEFVFGKDETFTVEQNTDVEAGLLMVVRALNLGHLLRESALNDDGQRTVTYTTGK